MTKDHKPFLTTGDYLFLITVVGVLVFTSQVNYLLYHSLVEIAIASIGFITFAFTWHLRRFELGNLLTIGILLGCTSFIGIFHLFAFKGMGVFVSDANLPTQLWLASRYQFSFFLLVSFVFTQKRLHANILLTTMMLSTAALLYVVFNGHFPISYIEGQGQTAFKISSEYIISSILIISMGIFWRYRSSFTPHVTKLTMTFFGFSIVTELVFTSYFSLYDFSNMMGHIFHFIGSFFLYKAIVQTGLENPFDSLFKNLNEAVQTRDEFISVASHELKTPLTPLKLHLQLFERELRKHPEIKIIEPVLLRMTKSSNLQVDRLNHLIDGMLDVSRLNTGRFEVFKTPTKIEDLLSELIKQNEVQFAFAKSELRSNLTPDTIDIDPLRIEQVLSNILSNALKYAPGSLVEIGNKKLANGKSVIWVSDTGPGMTDALKKRIFDRYERGASKTSMGGLGLGLYISRQIIEAHGGTLAVEGNIGEGSKFIIYL